MRAETLPRMTYSRAASVATLRFAVLGIGSGDCSPNLLCQRWSWPGRSGWQAHKRLLVAAGGWWGNWRVAARPFGVCYGLSAAPMVLHWQSWLPASVSTREASKKEEEARLVPWMRCRCQKVEWKTNKSILGRSKDVSDSEGCKEIDRRLCRVWCGED